MPGVILFPDKPYKFNWFKLKYKFKCVWTFTITLYLSYPIIIIVIIEAVPNKAPVNPYSLHPWNINKRNYCLKQCCQHFSHLECPTSSISEWIHWWWLGEPENRKLWFKHCLLIFQTWVNIMHQSERARLTTNMLDGVLRDLTFRKM